MKITKAVHKAGFTACETDGDGACILPAHWKEHEEWHVPDVLIRSVYQRMEERPFTQADLLKPWNDEVRTMFNMMSEAMVEDVISRIIKHAKTEEKIEQVGRARTAADATYKWTGRTGGWW